jgi:soluble lytic murein transglycosylase-like protein
MGRTLRFALLAALSITAVHATSARAAVPDCESLAEAAAAAHGIPLGILPAIARVESGKAVDGTVRAWPWTLNQGGAGSYHDTRQAALDTLASALATGRTNIDVGCMQLNWRWHAQAFPDAATMIDPVQNTQYAARFLRTLHGRHGSWDAAVAHYHSADPARGAAYAHKVTQAAALRAQSPEAPLHTAGAKPVAQRPEGTARIEGLLVRPAGGLLSRAAGTLLPPGADVPGQR